MAQKKKIMIIDDSATVIFWVRKVLGKTGYEVIGREVAIGSAAAILKEKPDLVLMDVNMPALNGDEIVRAFRRNKFRKNTRLVLHSSLPADELAQRAKTCQADGFIQKTNDRLKFIRQIRLYLQDAPEIENRKNVSVNKQIIVLSDRPLLSAAVKLFTSEYPHVETIYVYDDLEAARLIETREDILIVIIELQDKGTSVFKKTLTVLFDIRTSIPIIVIGTEALKEYISMRNNSTLVHSNPLRRSDLRNAIQSYLEPSD